MVAVKKLKLKGPGKYPAAKPVYSASEANELFFGVVGHVGSGTGFLADILKDILVGRGYDAEIISATRAIRRWATKNAKPDVPAEGAVGIHVTERLQTLGDEMRASSDGDCTAVAQGIIELIRERRALQTSAKVVAGEPVQPDQKPRAYIINSIRHPAEVNVFRQLYGHAFCLIGVVCHEDVRERRLTWKYKFHKEFTDKVSVPAIKALMDRDADDKNHKYGQHVADAFWESDFFFDNSAAKDDGENFSAQDELGRLVDIITHSTVVRPTAAETGMHVAVSAQIRSSCLSKQVGASILDSEGNVLATGTNEVPRAGGGVYGEGFDREKEDDLRCIHCHSPHCSSNAEQNQLIEKLISIIPSLKDAGDSQSLLTSMRKAGLGTLLEYTRAIHAEMDAITTASRRGIAIRNSRMFVTAFPCHYCARHIVASGILEVQYIEPYPKSRALSLHGDSITSRSAGWLPPEHPDALKKREEDRKGSDVKAQQMAKEVGNEKFGTDTNVGKVLFRPFTGVAPRLYHRAFTKDRKLKNDITGTYEPENPEWGGNWGLRMVPYTVLEAKLTSEDANAAP